MFALRFIGLSFLVLYGWSMGQIPANELNAFGKLVSFSFFLLAPAPYLLPTFEAWKKGHPNLTAIALVNIFLGWSLIGWVGAVVWAFKRPEVVPVVAAVTPTRLEALRETKTCPFCAEEILMAAVKCKHCSSEVPSAAPSLQANRA